MLMRKDSVLKGMFLAFALLLFICIAEDATVFAAPDPSIEKAGEDAVRLLAHFKAQSDKVRVYQTALRKAGAEDREVLQLQLALLQDSLLKDVHQLVDALVDLEDEEGRQSGVRPKVALVYDPDQPAFAGNGHTTAKRNRQGA